MRCFVFCLFFVLIANVFCSSSTVFNRLTQTITETSMVPTIHNRAPNTAIISSLIDLINSNSTSTWIAGRNDYLEGKSAAFIKQSCGLNMKQDFSLASLDQQPEDTKEPSIEDDNTLSTSSISASSLPSSFDSRDKWGNICPTLNQIRDQAGCGSCWSVAAASVMSDRTCIASNGRLTPYLSAQHILTCCGSECGSCSGGYPIYAMQYWRDSGVVSGGEYGSKGTCQPYFLEQCQHHTEGPRPKCTAVDTTPQCEQTCNMGGNKGLSYNEDKHYSQSAYKVDENEGRIMRDIYLHGPLEAGFMVYQDFPQYKSGVYSHVEGEAIGGHAVKLLGWGVEGGVKYWLASNSWNTDWGNNGYFKIKRGENECYIESMVYGGIPREQ
jgi:cathepsin B